MWKTPAVDDVGEGPEVVWTMTTTRTQGEGHIAGVVLEGVRERIGKERTLCESGRKGSRRCQMV